MADILPTGQTVYQTNAGYVCMRIDAAGACQTWAVMEVKQPDPLLPDLTQQQRNEVVTSVLGVFVLVWLFIMFKRAI